MTRSNPPWTRRGRFLRVFARAANVAAAARAAGIDRRTAYRWRDGDPNFARRWKAAEVRAAERLRDEAMERALVGRERFVYRYRPTAVHRAVRQKLLTPSSRSARPYDLAERLRQAEARMAPYLAGRAALFPNTDFSSDEDRKRGVAALDSSELPKG